MSFAQEEYSGLVYQTELKFQVFLYSYSLPKFPFHFVLSLRIYFSASICSVHYQSSATPRCRERGEKNASFAEE